MHTTISLCEAGTRLPALLRAVRNGKTFTITHRGEPVAELIPVRRAADGHATRAADQMRAFMRSHGLAGVDIRASIEEGRY